MKIGDTDDTKVQYILFHQAIIVTVVIPYRLIARLTNNAIRDLLMPNGSVKISALYSR